MERKRIHCVKNEKFSIPQNYFQQKWHFGRDFSQVKLAVNTNEGIKWYLSRGGARKKVGWEVRKVLHVIADVPTTTWKGWLHGHHFIIFFMPFFPSILIELTYLRSTHTFSLIPPRRLFLSYSLVIFHSHTIRQKPPHDPKL